MQLEIQYNPLYRNEKLQSSISPQVTNDLMDQLEDVKWWIEKQKEDWYIVALVHASFDTTHASHIQYINTIRAKIEQEIWKPFKLLVWVECDFMTKKRKNWKENIYSEWERKYILENLKSVDKCYIEFEWIDEQNNDARPAGIVQYLLPNVFVSHEEHCSKEDEEKVRQQAKDQWINHTVVVNYWDEEKYLKEQSNRDKYNLSTTNENRKIIKNFKWNPKYDL